MNKGEDLVNELVDTIANDFKVDVAYYDCYKVVGNVGHYLQDLETRLKDCKNELCYRCGSYKYRHEGACNGCKWLEE